MQTLVDFDSAVIFAIPLKDGGVREGMLLEGPQGWGEFGPDSRFSDDAAARWLTAATEPGTVGWPDPMRGRIPVAVSVPAVDATTAHQIVTASGCRTADVTITGVPQDIARLVAVRDALGSGGAIRCNAGGRWSVDEASAAIPQLDRAAGGLEYVQQPCASVAQVTAVRRRVDVPIAGDESILAAVDIAVLAVGPLGGARRALRIAEKCELPCVVASTVETTIGLAGGLALAGALPELEFACSLGTVPLLAGDLVTDVRSLVPRDGYLPVAPMPPAPDPDLVERFRLTGERADWWRSRLARARGLD